LLNKITDFEKKIKKETPKCFWILFQDQNHEFSSELLDSFATYSKYKGNSFKVKFEDDPIFHPTQLDK
jgi:hypothetical protein